MSGNRESRYELLERGIRLFERGYLEEAFRHFSDAHLAHPETPEIQSWYALGLALARGEHETAIRLARAAAKNRFHDPQTFMNLARIYLACDRKRQAIQSLKAALMADPDHRPAQIELARLGRRRRRMLRFLDRGHPLNQLLGRARARVAGR